MKLSRRANRMQRHHARRRRVPAMNLVSLMDIFTILVFFLLVNSSDIEVLPSTRLLELPEASSDVIPRQSVVIMVTRDQILLQGEPVFSFGAFAGPGEEALPALVSRLKSLVPDAEGVEVTLMGDQTIPFRLLRKIMASCTEAGFEHIALAVLQKLPGETG